MTSSFGGKRNVSNAPEKEQAGGRKALSDLSNSGKHPHQASKKSQDKKLTVMAEEQILPFHVSEEQFLHNHQECIKAQRNAKPLTGIIFGCYWTRQGWLLNAVGLSTVREIEA
ncbi:hypothetical protein LOK49_LG07G00392 [Camellia lanceoleosa]|uniref:Uncharacterized protein n=1 Tax=Camellia lanceoleosa TaxID=1840588 RepID=A0ACC0GZ15_9ERIC|nr:hypothetical protein LOK49_LG07G00392 [Camellia lanceoleosa]